MADKTQYGWAIVGTGLMGRLFPPDLMTVKGAKITAIVSRTLESAKQLAKLERCACVLTLCPKIEQARKLIEHAKEKKVFLMEALFSHFTPMWKQLHDLCSGTHEIKVGKPKSLECHIGIAQTPQAAPSLFSAPLSGGALGAVGVYPVNLCYTVFGQQPSSFSGKIEIGESGVDEVDEITFNYPSGATANWTGLIRQKHAEDAIIKAEHATIHLVAPWWCPKKIIIKKDNGEEHELKTEFDGNGYIFEAEEVQRCLQEGKLESDLMPLSTSLEIMELLDNLRTNLTK